MEPSGIVEIIIFISSWELEDIVFVKNEIPKLIYVQENLSLQWKN